MSVCGPSGSSSACSGAMYVGVPIALPVLVSDGVEGVVRAGDPEVGDLDGPAAA